MAVFLRKPTQNPKRILISRTDTIGDFILTLPVFEVLKQKLDCEISILCNKTVTPLLFNNRNIDNIITVDQQYDVQKLISKIESHQFDVLLVLVNDPIIQALLPKLKSIPVRIGPLSKPSVFFFYTHPVVQKRSRSVKNEAEYNLELLKIFNLGDIPSTKPKIFITPDEIRKFKSVKGSLFQFKNSPNQWVVLHGGMRGSALNWTKEYYQKLLIGLLNLRLNVVLTGAGQAEEDANQELRKAVDNRFPEQLVDVSNQLTLRELAVLLFLSRLYIGPSTGPTHMANAVGTRIISLYPPIKVQSAKRWEPYLADSHIFTPKVDCRQKYKCIGEKCRDYFCLDLIYPKDVLAQVEKIILNDIKKR